LNDYEGISGYEEFRGDLTLMYFAGFNSLTGHLFDLELVPLQMRRFQLVPASGADILWLWANTRPRERAVRCAHQIEARREIDRIKVRSRQLTAPASCKGALMNIHQGGGLGCAEACGKRQMAVQASSNRLIP
jgi:hypothetical protein